MLLDLSSDTTVIYTHPVPTATMVTRQTGIAILLICLLFSTSYIQPVLAAQTKCYTMTGILIEDENVVPCNPSATGGAGSHSSCCNQKEGDVCLSTGLCLSPKAKTPSNMLWTNGCTDPTWNDSSCPQYCNPPVNSTGKLILGQSTTRTWLIHSKSEPSQV